MTDREVYQADVAVADLAEPLGFESIWGLEHHFTGYAMCPDVMQFLTYMAARTERVRLGSMVAVLPWHDPLRLAEQILMLDNLSGGRLILGMGRGTGKLTQMIILTDGEDFGSQLAIKDAIEAAQKADSICYVLLIADRGFYGGFGYSGESDMRKLTEATGGRVINVGNKFDKLKEAFDQIAAELRSQYNIGYTPTNAKLDGSYRKLEIKNKQGNKIQARAGYYAGKSEN